MDYTNPGAMYDYDTMCQCRLRQPFKLNLYLDLAATVLKLMRTSSLCLLDTLSYATVFHVLN